MTVIFSLIFDFFLNDSYFNMEEVFDFKEMPKRKTYLSNKDTRIHNQEIVVA